MIQELPSTGNSSSRSRLLDVLRDNDTPEKRPADGTAIPSPAPADRARQLASIRSRVRKGFYNTDAVLEDLSDSFASVFDKLS